MKAEAVATKMNRPTSFMELACVARKCRAGLGGNALLRDVPKGCRGRWCDVGGGHGFASVKTEPKHSGNRRWLEATWL